LLDSLLKVQDFIVYEILVYFHLFFEVAHLALVYELQDAGTCILNCLDRLLLEFEDFLTDLSFEPTVALIVYGLPLQVEELRFGLCEFQTLKVSAHKRGDEVEPVVLVELAEAVNADPLLVIKAEEVQLLAMQTAVYGYRLLLAGQLQDRRDVIALGRIFRRLTYVCLVIQI
jgi:hypothetical protein